MYASAVIDASLFKIMNSEEEWEPKVVIAYVPFGDRSIDNKILFLIIKVWKVMFNSIYFYFFPFLCILLNFVSRRCSSIEEPKVSLSDNGTVAFGSDPLCTNLEVFYIADIFRKGMFTYHKLNNTTSNL